VHRVARPEPPRLRPVSAAAVVGGPEAVRRSLEPRAAGPDQVLADRAALQLPRLPRLPAQARHHPQPSREDRPTTPPAEPGATGRGSAWVRPGPIADATAIPDGATVTLDPCSGQDPLEADPGSVRWLDSGAAWRYDGLGGLAGEAPEREARTALTAAGVGESSPSQHRGTRCRDESWP
jgi:hypothetical protein